MTDDGSIKVEDFTSCRYGGANETLQEPTEHESHNDSAYFNLAPGDAAGVVGAVIRVGMRPNDGYSELSVVMPRSDGTVVFHYARSPLSAADFAVGSPKWESGPLTLEALEPTRRWRLLYTDGDARLVTDPRAFADKPGEVWRASDPVRCEFDLDWVADFPVHVLSPGGNLMPGSDEITYGKNHYEQFGHVSGTLRLGEEEWRIDAAPTFRDHSWGPRIWESAPDQDFVSVYLDDGRRVAAVANRIDGREDAHGIIWRPGDTQPIQIERYEIRVDYSGEPVPPPTIGWTFAGADESISIEGNVLGYMPLRVGKNPVRIAQTILRLEEPAAGRAKTDLTRPIIGG
jgi:hypothetical protein